MGSGGLCIYVVLTVWLLGSGSILRLSVGSRIFEKAHLGTHVLDCTVDPWATLEFGTMTQTLYISTVYSIQLKICIEFMVIPSYTQVLLLGNPTKWYSQLVESMNVEPLTEKNNKQQKTNKPMCKCSWVSNWYSGAHCTWNPKETLSYFLVFWILSSLSSIVTLDNRVDSVLWFPWKMETMIGLL